MAYLLSLGIAAIEIAPFNIFGTWSVGRERISALRKQLDDAGMSCPALQGIVHNVPGAHLFQSAQSRAILRTHLGAVARMAGLLGAKACVFGAPRLRDPGLASSSEAYEVAIKFLQTVAPAFSSEGTSLSFEPNAAAYGCRFVTTTAQAIELVANVNSPGVRLQIDTGTIFLEREDPAVLNNAVAWAAHAHISEPGLEPIGTCPVDHNPLAAALASSGYQGSISIEMKATTDWQRNIAQAVTVARRIYGT